jgi:hypothetical protein
MGKSAYRSSLELRLAEIGFSITIAKRRLAAAHSHARLVNAAELFELENRHARIVARLRALDAAGEGLGSDARAELDRMMRGLTDSIGDWMNDIDREYGDRLH